MTGRESLSQFLTVDPVDAGCTETFAMLDRFAERVVAGDAERRFPSVGAHLRVCAPCAEDLTGLLELMGEPA
jgi:hypothetical protein